MAVEKEEVVTVEVEREEVVMVEVERVEVVMAADLEEEKVVGEKEVVTEVD